MLRQAGKYLNRYWATLGDGHRVSKGYTNVEGLLHPEIFEVLKDYTNQEGVAPFIKRLKSVVEQIEQRHQNRDQELAQAG